MSRARVRSGLFRRFYIGFLIIIAALYTLPAQAGVREWFKGFCERHLIADDPWPLAKESSRMLLIYVRNLDNSVALAELEYRRRHGLLTPAEEIEFHNLFHPVFQDQRSLESQDGSD